MVNVTITQQIHIRYEGQSHDIPFDEFSQDVGFLSTDDEIKTAIANHLGVPQTKLNNFNLSRNDQTETITLRPQASFGDQTEL